MGSVIYTQAHIRERIANSTAEIIESNILKILDEFENFLDSPAVYNAKKWEYKFYAEEMYSNALVCKIILCLQSRFVAPVKVYSSGFLTDHIKKMPYTIIGIVWDFS